MVSIWRVVYTKQAQKDVKKLKSARLSSKTQELIKAITKDPYCPSPPYKKLVGDLNGIISRRINIHHRLIYEVFEAEKTIKIIHMWSHYE